MSLACLCVLHSPWDFFKAALALVLGGITYGVVISCALMGLVLLLSAIVTAFTGGSKGKDGDDS